ncbi:hypothetical protein [Streptomyces sp. HUAS TT7]|uniref:hypothetical protein n=1 Tax=Streptomyces sp. HUAS TT7 TaxID=3447507 RepID=UPI003F65BDE4
MTTVEPPEAALTPPHPSSREPALAPDALSSPEVALTPAAESGLLTRAPRLLLVRPS